MCYFDGKDTLEKKLFYERYSTVELQRKFWYRLSFCETGFFSECAVLLQH